ncbi:hypothetical protein B0H11DRAFT_2384239 [Mycena galericulata]|nr:hypothetical protein B0H11DRAFT_2384239 [Mycena galericulata]
MAKALFPAPTLLEALQFAHFHGNPDAATYEDAIHLLSQWLSDSAMSEDHIRLSDNSRSFPVTGDFIKKLNQTCIIDFVNTNNSVRHTLATPKKSVPAFLPPHNSSRWPHPMCFCSLPSTSFPAPHFDTGYLNYSAFTQQPEAQMHQVQQASAAQLSGPLLPMLPNQPNVWLDALLA